MRESSRGSVRSGGGEKMATRDTFCEIRGLNGAQSSRGEMLPPPPSPSALRPLCGEAIGSPAAPAEEGSAGRTGVDGTIHPRLISLRQQCGGGGVGLWLIKEEGSSFFPGQLKSSTPSARMSDLPAHAHALPNGHRGPHFCKWLPLSLYLAASSGKTLA